MTEHAPEACFDKLPPELLGFIIPSPHDLNDLLPAHYWPWNQGWLAIKQTWKAKDEHDEEEAQRQEMLRTLRALCETSRRLRAFTLPILWSIIHLSTIDELGRLRETFRVSPHLARHVRTFWFLWDLGGDVTNQGQDWYSYYAEEEGTLLDFAFRNRMELWESVRARHGCEVKREARTGDGTRYLGSTPLSSQTVFFEHDGQRYQAPGECAHGQGWEERKPVWDYDAPRTGVDGPDGKGEDRLIKNAEQFKESFTEIVAQLSSLESFGWLSYVTPMPAGVFDALISSQTLTALSVGFTTERSNVCDLPLWKISPRLTALGLRVIEDDVGDDLDHRIQEQTEAEVNAVEAPLSSPIVDRTARDEYHAAVVSRTIVAAAKEGQLDYLGHDVSIQKPFAIRTMLPSWAQLEICNGIVREWQATAKALRLLLAHTSYLHERREIRDNRLHTLHDVRSLLSSFKNNKGLPKVTRARHEDFRYVERYLTWLSEDKELAQRVTDAWNAVVQRGEARFIQCCCDECPGEVPAGEESLYDEEESSDGSW